MEKKEDKKGLTPTNWIAICGLILTLFTFIFTYINNRPQPLVFDITTQDNLVHSYTNGDSMKIVFNGNKDIKPINYRLEKIGKIDFGLVKSLKSGQSITIILKKKGYEFIQSNHIYYSDKLPIGLKLKQKLYQKLEVYIKREGYNKSPIFVKNDRLHLTFNGKQFTEKIEGNKVIFDGISLSEKGDFTLKLESQNYRNSTFHYDGFEGKPITLKIHNPSSHSKVNYFSEIRLNLYEFDSVIVNNKPCSKVGNIAVCKNNIIKKESNNIIIWNNGRSKIIKKEFNEDKSEYQRLDDNFQKLQD